MSTVNSKATALRRAGAFLVAVVVAVALGAMIQTQYNLAALAALGVDIPLAIRLRTTGQDLLGFSPVYAVLVVLALLCSLPVAALCARRLSQRAQLLVYGLAALVGLVVAVLVVNQLVPMPTLIAATRAWHGLLLLALAAGVGGVVFARLVRASAP